MRPVATPPDAAFVPFWMRQTGAVVGVLVALLREIVDADAPRNETRRARAR
jgi:hypothetical protein